MRVAIVGLGSMGKRRIRCLQAAGEKDLVAIDPREDRRAEAQEKLGVRTASDLERVWRDVNAVVVCVPGFLHMRYCLAAARAGKHWFCEVPLTVNLDGIEELKSLTKQKRLVGAPGCQLLFHPMAQALYAWAHQGEQSRILHGSYAYGTYLPEWHRYEDYRNFYASDLSKGGGNTDVIAQELTWLSWIAGRSIRAVTARTGKIGTLELANGTPDHQELIVEFDGGLMFSMHYDLNDQTHERLVRLASAKGTAKWSNLQPFVEFYCATKKQWQKHPEAPGFEYEQCYREEIARFVQCMHDGSEWPIPIDLAEQIVRVLVAINESAVGGRTVLLSEVG